MRFDNDCNSTVTPQCVSSAAVFRVVNAKIMGRFSRAINDVYFWTTAIGFRIFFVPCVYKQSSRTIVTNKTNRFVVTVRIVVPSLGSRGCRNNVILYYTDTRDETTVIVTVLNLIVFYFSVQDHIQEVLDKWTQIDDEIWAKVIVLERNRRVAKAYARAPILTVNGSDEGFDGYRYTKQNTVRFLTIIYRVVPIRLENKSCIYIYMPYLYTDKNTHGLYTHCSQYDISPALYA